MISEITLKYLSAQKRLDALALKKAGRNSAAIYLMGYALELALKRKITQTLNFSGGSPEWPAEFSTYLMQIQAFNSIATGVQLSSIRQIKNHKLELLLSYSGAESRVKASYVDEWLIVKDWNPEDRYVLSRYTKIKVAEFIRAAQLILGEII
jgi:hypothetical protein